MASIVATLRQQVVKPGVRTLFHEGVTGRVDENEIRVRYQRTWSRNDFAPEFVGTFKMVAEHRSLVGEFRAGRSTRVFLAFWIGFVAIWWVLAFATTLGSPEPGIPMPLVLLVPPIMIGFAIGLTRVGQHLGESDIRRIEATLRSAVDSASSVRAG